MGKTEVIKSWIIIAQFVFIVGYISLHDCSRKEDVAVDRTATTKEIKATKAAIEEGKKEIEIVDIAVNKADEKVIRTKRKAKEFVYPMTFDSTATVDTLKKVLAVADSAVIYWRDTVVAAQQEAIQERDTALIKRDSTLKQFVRLDMLQEQDKSILEEQSKHDKKQVRKQKFKRILATVGGGLAVVGGGIMLFNPVTGVIVVATGGTILIISAIKGPGE